MICILSDRQACIGSYDRAFSHLIHCTLRKNEVLTYNYMPTYMSALHRISM